jgi:hypothetical protein
MELIMGSRSITKITFTDTTLRLYLHWGSPEYQIPNMAEFVFWAWTFDHPWTSESYHAYLATIPGGVLPDEPSDNFHGDLEHYYRLRFGERGEIDYAYRHRDVGAEEWTEVFHATDRAELYNEAVRRLETHRAWVAKRANAHPGDTRAAQDLAAIERHLDEAHLHAQIEALPGAAGSASQTDFHTRHECDPLDCSIWAPDLNQATERRSR